eukprot:gene14643-31153_t
MKHQVTPLTDADLSTDSPDYQFHSTSCYSFFLSIFDNIPILLGCLGCLLSIVPALYQKSDLDSIEIFTTTTYSRDDLQGSGETALGIINDFLTYDKIDAGMLKLELERVLFWDLVENSIRPFFLQ